MMLVKNAAIVELVSQVQLIVYLAIMDNFYKTIVANNAKLVVYNAHH